MVDQKIADIVNFIKKEYKSVAGSALSLKKEGETDILVQKMSNIRTWYQTISIYNIGGLGADQDTSTAPSGQKLEENIKNWLKTARL